MASLNPSSDGYKPYYPIIEQLLEYLEDKEDVRLQLVAYAQTPDGETQTEVFYYNTGVRDLMAAAGILQMLGTKMDMEDEQDEEE